MPPSFVNSARRRRGVGAPARRCRRRASRSADGEGRARRSASACRAPATRLRRHVAPTPRRGCAAGAGPLGRHHQQIEQAVVVVVERTAPPARRRLPAAPALTLKRAAAVAQREARAAGAAEEEVGAVVLVDVARGGAEAGPVRHEAELGRHVAERAVALFLSSTARRRAATKRSTSRRLSKSVGTTASVCAGAPSLRLRGDVGERAVAVVLQQQARRGRAAGGGRRRRSAAWRRRRPGRPRTGRASPSWSMSTSAALTETNGYAGSLAAAVDVLEACRPSSGGRGPGRPASPRAGRPRPSLS